MWPSNESRALCTRKHMQICRYKKVNERSVDQKCHHDEHSSPNRSQLIQIIALYLITLDIVSLSFSPLFYFLSRLKLTQLQR